MKFGCNKFFVLGVAYMLGMIAIGLGSMGRHFDAYDWTPQLFAVIMMMAVIPFFLGYFSEVKIQ